MLDYIQRRLVTKQTSKVIMEMLIKAKLIDFFNKKKIRWIVNIKVHIVLSAAWCAAELATHLCTVTSPTLQQNSFLRRSFEFLQCHLLILRKRYELLNVMVLIRHPRTHRMDTDNHTYRKLLYHPLFQFNINPLPLRSILKFLQLIKFPSPASPKSPPMRLILNHLFRSHFSATNSSTTHIPNPQTIIPPKYPYPFLPKSQKASFFFFFFQSTENQIPPPTTSHAHIKYQTSRKHNPQPWRF